MLSPAARASESIIYLRNEAGTVANARTANAAKGVEAAVHMKCRPTLRLTGSAGTWPVSRAHGRGHRLAGNITHHATARAPFARANPP